MRYGPGWVFFPFIRGWDGRYDFIDMFDEEHHVLVGLLNLLSDIIRNGYHSVGAVIGGRMVMAMMEVINVCRRNKHEAVRAAAWQSLIRVIAVIKVPDNARSRPVIDIGLPDTTVSTLSDSISTGSVQYVEQVLGVDIDSLLFAMQDTAQNDASQDVRNAAMACGTALHKLVTNRSI